MGKIQQTGFHQLKAEDLYFALQVTSNNEYQVDIFTEIERTEGLAGSEPDALYFCEPKNIVLNNRPIFDDFC